MNLKKYQIYKTIIIVMVKFGNYISGNEILENNVNKILGVLGLRTA